MPTEPEDSPELKQTQTKTRTLTKPGHHRVTIQVKLDAWAKIQAHIDANTLDESKWLTQQLTKLAEGLNS
jgi:hypothetical protein